MAKSPQLKIERKKERKLNEVSYTTNMTREESIERRAVEHIANDPFVAVDLGEESAYFKGFVAGAKWADEHPSDETIMRILNAVGYEEKSWIEVVRKHLQETQ